MFTSEGLEQIKAANDIVEVAARYTTLKGKGNELYGPCPVCEGTDRFHVNQRTQAASCRHCHENMQQWIDVIDLVRFAEGCDFREAVERLGGRDDQPLPRRVVRRPPEPKPEAWRTSEWQANAQTIVNATIPALDSASGAPGRTYLDGRGIQPETWRAWRLGYSTTRRAVVFPWFVNADVSHVQYRYVTPGNMRFGSETDGTRTLYGLHMVDPAAHTLFIVEGELNALSIWQACRDLDVTVVSIGSQSTNDRTLKAVQRLAQQFQRVAVWCDEADRAQTLMQTIGQHAIGFQSPKQNGAKLDANDLLQRGMLRAVIERRLGLSSDAPVTVAELGQLLRRVLRETTDFIPRELCTFYEGTPPAERAAIKQQLEMLLAASRKGT